MPYCHHPCAPGSLWEPLALLWHLSGLLCSIPGRSTGTSDPSHFFLTLLTALLLFGVPFAVLKTLSALPLAVEPSWQGPQEQPWSLASSRIALCFLPSPHPHPWVSLSPFLEEVQDPGSPARAGSMACPAGLGVNGLCVGLAIKIMSVVG